MKKSSLLLSILIFLNSNNTLGLELRQYCFNRSVSLDRVKIYLSQITLDKDIINLNNKKHCIDIGVDENRVELFQKYLSMNYEFRETTESKVKRRECLFEVETIKNSFKKSSKVKLGKVIQLRNSQQNSEGKSISKIRVMERKLAKLVVNESLITVSCKIRGHYTEVDIRLADRKKSLSTSIQLSKSQRIDLANVVQDLSNKSSEVSISNGVQYSKTSGTKKDQVFLILK
ncbi:hypothetical protein [Halobacteriovorax sp.]|uniref:hypothetical protein n=1 Tax=Halobacteriovorax sp. TaxID=2020862 RepID=UPI003567D43F